VSSMILAPTELALINLSGVLGAPILTELPSRNTSMVSLQNMPQSVTVCALRQYSLWIQEACSRRTVS
jgi:hypothetical protein